MAEIRDDHIKCDKTDPWLKIRIPISLLYWVDEAAEYRGISTEELVNEALYDRFGKTVNTKGEYKKLHANEKLFRRRLTQHRYELRLQNRLTQGRSITPEGVMACNKKVNWTAYEQIRKANLDLLETAEFRTSLKAKTPTTAEIEALRVELEQRGIKRNYIEIGKRKIWVRDRRGPKSKPGDKKVYNVPLGTNNPVLGTRFGKGQVKQEAAAAAQMAALLTEIKDACRACGATQVLRNIESAEIEARASKVLDNNHTK